MTFALVIAALCLGLSSHASAQHENLDDLLARTSKNVTQFLDEFSDVKCTEYVTQLKLGKNEKVEAKQESTFDYLVILTNAGGQLNLSESRLAEHGGKQVKNLPLLVTNGFATLFLVFHPYYEGSFQFSQQEDDFIGGKRYVRVRFEHIKGTRSPTALVLRGREYPLELAGTAWIDPDSGVVAKIVAGLDNGLEDLGLRMLRSEVDYAPVSLRDIKQSYWFPTLASIEVETPKQHWRNTHRFTDYKQFSVSTEEVIAKKP
ncbi:MAG TPA: hypothetical protein VE994_08800 [Terriglobales bacterium]|nr:hypothetical protein [Terriglobales bacterium]